MEKKTKIICTIGPAVSKDEVLKQMFDAGMNVARINFSHGSHEAATLQIAQVRRLSEEMEKHIAVLLDTKGPEIRVGTFVDGQVSYNTGDIVSIKKGSDIGNKQSFSIECEELFEDVKVGDNLLIDDGKIRLTIKEIKPNELICVFENGGVIKDRKGVNVPGVVLSMPFVSEQDYSDIEFGCSQNVDLIALSFVRRKEDVLEVKQLLKKFHRPEIEVIAKIENQESLNNIESIIEVADGIMVARGDLGVEIPSELVPFYQKKIIKLANSAGKPVITATHMLESMITNPRPTRAEVSDVANAILDGSDAIMLSGESAVGKYPVESVTMMTKIANNTEEMIDYGAKLQENIAILNKTQNDVIGICASESALTLKNVVAIFAFTQTGGTAKRICKFRPKVPIIACTDKVSTCRRLSYYWGVFPMVTNYVDDISACDKITCETAKKLGFPKGSKIIITSGFGQKHGVTNTLRIIDCK